MKRFAAVSLAALMLLTVFASAASAVSSIEIRGPVFNGSDIDDIIDTYGDGTELTVDATEFAAFYYDIDDNVTTETFTIKDVDGTEGNVIGEGGMIYKTTIQQVEYEYENADAGWSNYSLIGFFAEKYIPLKSNSADKLAKLVLDSDDKYTLRTGELLDLGEGYAIEAKQVDVDGEKVWLEFTKDGEFVDDEIISVAEGADNTWEVELDDVQDEDDVVVLRVHVNQVFQGAVDSIAQIEGLWLIDYANAMTIESDDEFGDLDDVSIQGDTLVITNEDTFTLTRDDEDEIGQGMFFKTADTPVSELRYYPFVEKIIDGGEGPTTNATEVVTETETEGNISEEVTPTEEVPTETEEMPTETEPGETEPTETEPSGGIPGFGFMFGLVGLLAVVYLVRRNS